MSNETESEEIDYFTESIAASSVKKEKAEVDGTNDPSPAENLTSPVKTRSSLKGFINIIVIVTGAAVGGYFGYNMMANQALSQLPESGSASQLVIENQPQASTASKAIDMLDAAVANASVYFSEKATFKGFKPGKPIRVAANAESIVMVVNINGECYSNGIAAGYDSVTRFDPSGNRCDPANFKNLQKIMKNK
jgi:hypothetical protein